MKTKHTKGRWKQVWNENNSPSTCIIKSVISDVLTNKTKDVSICSIKTNESDMYNANLIVAAPELLEALQLIYSLYGNRSDFISPYKQAWIKAEEAIKKATK
jgi:hypothetical protein